MKKIVAISFGAFSYLIFTAVFLYTIGFMANIFVPKSIDNGVVYSTWGSLLIDLSLLGLFSVQHSGMARRRIKRWEKNIIAEPIQRSVYVLLASLSLALLYWQWRPLPEMVWEVQTGWGRLLFWGLFGLGWGLVLSSTFLISHAHMFGLQQVWAYLHGQENPMPGFQTPGPYRYVRHPLYLGLLIAFWSTPFMTVGHFVFAFAFSVYILLGARLEERDLVFEFGKRYVHYREQTSMLIPGLRSGTRLSRSRKPD